MGNQKSGPGQHFGLKLQRHVLIPRGRSGSSWIAEHGCQGFSECMARYQIDLTAPEPLSMEMEISPMEEEKERERAGLNLLFCSARSDIIIRFCIELNVHGYGTMK